jgi:4'-phosphopantetheinyl transferase
MSLSRCLSPDEKTRGDQFTFGQERRNFIVSNGILRDILSRHPQCEPAIIQFRNEPNGKPNLTSQDIQDKLDFNLSHSSGYLVVAVTQGLKVGVDIELIRPLPDMDLIASHSFSKYEQAALSLLPDRDKEQGFFRG